MLAHEFEWDDAKNGANYRKHGLSFEKASIAFEDPFCVTYQDRFENGEYRWQTLGLVDDTLIVLVAHLILENEDDAVLKAERIRIISARAASPSERKRYDRENRPI